MKVRAAIYSGAGNTFTIINEEALTSSGQMGHESASHLRSVLAQKSCQLTGTDGFIFLKKTQPNRSHYEWDFYNNDGSVAEMCGNATRCVADYVKKILKDPSLEITLKTIAGTVNIQSEPLGLNFQYRVEMPQYKIFDHPKYFWCDTGVPHVVYQIPDLKLHKTYFDLCQKLRFHSDFGDKGTNVTLIQVTSQQNQVLAVSYERGVENFTQACGTGAVAAGLFCYKTFQSLHTEVIMPGGNLKIQFQNEWPEKVFMTGPAILTGQQELEFS